MENKRIWNLTWNTNIYATDDPDLECRKVMNRPLTATFPFTDFETAKREALRVIELYARSNNGLFDGKGGYAGFEDYVRSETEEDESVRGFGLDLDGFFRMRYGFPIEKFRDFPEQLRESILSGFTKKPDPIMWDNHYIRIESDDEKFYLGGSGDGPEMVFKSNMFDMSDPKIDYYFEISGNFENSENGFERSDPYEPVEYINLYLFSDIPNEEIELDFFCFDPDSYFGSDEDDEW